MIAEALGVSEISVKQKWRRVREFKPIGMFIAGLHHHKVDMPETTRMRWLADGALCHTNLSAALLGDPLPGRSALDMKAHHGHERIHGRRPFLARSQERDDSGTINRILYAARRARRQAIPGPSGILSQGAGDIEERG